jgi:hypothetical protein
VTPVLPSGEGVPGPTLLLRPSDTGDIPQVLDIYTDPVMRQSWQNPLVTEQDVRRWLEVQQQGWADGHRLSFAVLDSESGRVLGNVALKGCRAGKDAAEVGYWTPPWHGTVAWLARPLRCSQRGLCELRGAGSATS